MAHSHDLPVMVDATVSTPYLTKPIKWGADIVIHSMTKYIGGHADVVSGVAVVRDEALAEDLGFLQNSIGAIAGPFDSFLALRGTKTLALRMQRHNENAMAVAEFLSGHGVVQEVIYPGLASHPQHALAQRQMSGFGGMVSARLAGDVSSTVAALTRLEVFTIAESLGVESLIEHPAIMTHASLPEAQRRALGIDDTLIRLSVGIEHADDLIGDLDRALA